MSKRRAYIAGAAAAGILAAGGAILAVSGAQAGTSATAAVTSTTTIPGTKDIWAPPPPNAAPALTAAQAWATFASLTGWDTAITSDMTVQLGALTHAVGPYCGTECDMYTTVNGISYLALNELAYGYYWSSCPSGTSLPETACENWFFLDANTGKLIIGATPRLGPPGPTKSSY